MERLTKINDSGETMLVDPKHIIPTYSNYIGTALDKLAAYEDIGPLDEVRRALRKLRWYEALFDQRPYDQWREIAKAEDEGRLVVLPCKVGDGVYERDRRIMQVYRIIPPSAAFIMSENENGVEFYKTREEAEKALEGVSEDG